MKHCLVLLLPLLASCSGTLSEEQRKKIREEMENSKITRVTDVQITEAAFAKGRSIVGQLKQGEGKMDSLSKTESVSIQKILAIDSAGHPMLKEMFEAYQGSSVASLQDNVQKIRDHGIETDSLLYTEPIVIDERFIGMWSIWLSKKRIVKGLSK